MYVDNCTRCNSSKAWINCTAGSNNSDGNEPPVEMRNCSCFQPGGASPTSVWICWKARGEAARVGEEQEEEEVLKLRFNTCVFKASNNAYSCCARWWWSTSGVDSKTDDLSSGSESHVIVSNNDTRGSKKSSIHHAIRFHSWSRRAVGAVGAAAGAVGAADREGREASRWAREEVGATESQTAWICVNKSHVDRERVNSPSTCWLQYNEAIHVVSGSEAIRATAATGVANGQLVHTSGVAIASLIDEKHTK
jgi:hypothetical protein